MQAGTGSVNWNEESDLRLLSCSGRKRYNSHHWCQQEVLWADEYATPAVLVEARTNLNHPAGTLPFDRVPTVRIPDGNLLRILFLALREGLRFLYFSAPYRRDEKKRHLANAC